MKALVPRSAWLMRTAKPCGCRAMGAVRKEQGYVLQLCVRCGTLINGGGSTLATALSALPAQQGGATFSCLLATEAEPMNAQVIAF